MGAIAFNDNLSRWSVGKVTNMNSLFLGAFAFEGNGLENWDTSRVTDMKSILRHADNFNGDISTWNVSLVSTFYQAFEFCPLNADLSQWDTRQATNMMQMFANAKAFNSTLATWNVARVTNMVEMVRRVSQYWKLGARSSIIGSSTVVLATFISFTKLMLSIAIFQVGMFPV
jgi:surface protein